ncbi:MAG TPA: nuclear transport factor 2 family protein [Sphingomicrobium sp.]|nr:nuclear transport factor 2 family protein [Sphingomicrobium sp.]
MSRALLIGPLALAVAAAAPAASKSDPEATVKSFHAALQAGDAKAAADLLADDALIFEEGGAERSKAEYAARHLSADIAFAKAVPAQVTRRSGHVAGDLGWVVTEGRLTGTYKDKAIDRATTETMILRRVGSEWKIVHIHWSSAAAQ